MSSSNISSQLIADLDTALKQTLLQPTSDNVRSCCLLIQQCHYRRLQEEKTVRDDSLYIPVVLLLRQFPRFQTPAAFDELLQQAMAIFELIPVSSKKVLDDLLCVVSIILTKRVMATNDEIQQDLFIRFFRAFCQSVKINIVFFYREFLGNFNQNLPILGHFISCFLQLYEKIRSLDYRLNVLHALWSIISINTNENENEHRLIVGQMLACFLPGILKTLAQDLHSAHQRLSRSVLILLSYIIRVTAQLAPRYPSTAEAIKNELRDLVVERNETWLRTVDTHIAPLLQRFTADFANHDNVSVRRALGVLMLTILGCCSTSMMVSASIALKTMLVLVSSMKEDPNEELLKALLKNLFKLPLQPSSFVVPLSTESGIANYENEFISEVIRSSAAFSVSDQLLISCQADLFQLLEQQQGASTYTDRRLRLQLFIGYYAFLHHHVDFLFDMDTFAEKFLRFLFRTLDFDTLMRSHLNLLNASSLPDHAHAGFDRAGYHSVYAQLKPDVHNHIQRIVPLFTDSHQAFPTYLFEQINSAVITSENNQKIFYLLSVIFEKTNFDNADGYQLLLSLLTRLICDESNRKQTNRRRRKDRLKQDEPVSLRNVTIYYLLHCLRTLTSPLQTEYLIEYVPLLLLCHSSIYSTVHQTALLCLTTLSADLPTFLAVQSEYVIDTSLRKLQTSTYDGYLILIELVRLGQAAVINLPIMTHVIEQLLLELSCLPSVECIELTFQFLNVFCQRVLDIADSSSRTTRLASPPTKSLVDFALDLQRQSAPPEPAKADETDDTKKEQHPWHQMLVSIVDVFQHFISHSNAHIRSHVLDAFPSLADLLSTIDENLLLPLVHKLWPGLIHRLHDVDISIRIRCLTTIECLCLICSDFVDRRLRQDVLPVLIQQLEKNRLLSPSNALEYRYTKYLLTKIGTILHAMTVNVADMERIILILLQYLQVEPLASIAYEQLMMLSSKHSDLIWLMLVLHEQDEFVKGCFDRMKVYKPVPMFSIDAKWKSSLITASSTE